VRNAIFVGISLAVIVIVSFFWAAFHPVVESSTPFEVSGTIEADEIAISPDVGGRVIEITASEGEEVRAGQVLVRLDEDLLISHIGEAQSLVDAAEAELALVKAGHRQEEIEQAEADLAKATAARDGAKTSWENAIALRDNPHELNAQIDAAGTQVELARSEVEAWQINIERAQRTCDKYAWDKSTEGKTAYAVALSQLEIALAGLNTAQASLAGAERDLENLIDIHDNPLEANAAINAAWWAYKVAEGGVQLAEARLASMEATPSTEETRVSQAKLDAALAAQEALEVQLGKMRVSSPIDGLVTGRSIHVGEMAAPGGALLKVADLDEVELTVYVPTDQIGWIKVGKDVQVKVDSYPGNQYPGRVVYISPKVEFTPKNVQTKEERSNAVFAVKIQLPNPRHELKPGMPADAYFQGVD
jgi:HlyD family secretion protein